MCPLHCIILTGNTKFCKCLNKGLSCVEMLCKEKIVNKVVYQKQFKIQ